jgi:hypothetical protein
MKKSIYYLMLSLVLVMQSCDPCKNLDCLHNDYFGEFRIVDEQNGDDLLFGSAKLYDKNKVTFYSLSSKDTIRYPFKAERIAGSINDSLINVDFFPAEDKVVFIKWKSDDIDTITVHFRTFDTECCGKITEIEKFKYRNYNLEGKGLQVIKK